MNKSIVKTTGVILLAAPFMALAGDNSYENHGAFSTPIAGSSDIRKSDVSSSEMYAWEQRNTYEFDLSGPSSSERAEIAVFSETDVTNEISLPTYTGDYGGDDE